MKKKLYILASFFIAIFFVIGIKNSKVEAEQYQTFESIKFENDVTLMDEWTEYQEETYYSRLGKTKMFGWNIYYSLKKEKFSYVGETLYHVKNNGFSDVVHTFKYEETTEDTIQRTTKGSIELSGSGSKEKFKFGLESELEYEYKESKKTKTTQTDTVKIVISPKSELYIKVMGEGYLYQGVARQYIFFIKAKEGGFEYAIITTEYYSIDIEEL